MTLKSYMEKNGMKLLHDAKYGTCGAYVTTNSKTAEEFIEKARNVGVEGEFVTYQHYGYKYVGTETILSPTIKYWYVVTTAAGNDLLD